MDPVTGTEWALVGRSNGTAFVDLSDPDHQDAEICVNSNEDTVTIVDVTNKSNPTQVSRTGYSGAAYTHQGWLTEDHSYFIHDDEIDELTFGHTTKTYVWDVTNLDAPTLVGTFFADGMAIDHSQYILGGHTYQANYRRSLRVLSLDDLSTGTLSEVAYFAIPTQTVTACRSRALGASIPISRAAS